jgi:LEA14-like dessication related protein
MKLLFRLLFICLVAFCFSACKHIEPPTFSGFESYKINKANGNQVELELKLKLKNPNSVNIFVKKYDFDVSVNGTIIGKAKSNESIKLLKETEQAYPVYLQTDLKYMLAQILPGLSSIIANKPIELKLEGYIKGGAYGLTKKFPIKVSRPLDMKQLMKMRE